MSRTEPRSGRSGATAVVGRVGERYRAVGFELTWSPPVRTLFGVRSRPVVTEVIDLSVSGALLVAPPNPLLMNGTTVEIAHGRLRGRVKIRHIHAATSGRVHYGVLFVELEPALQDAIFERVGNLRNAAAGGSSAR